MAEALPVPPTRRAVLADAATEWAFATGWRIVKLLPARAAYRAFDAAADVIWRRRGGDVLQLERNLARIHPDATADELRLLSRRSVRSYMRYWCDAFRLPTWSPEEVNRTCVLDRKEIIDEAIASGSGIILVANHSGNWDHIGAWGCLRYGGITTVVEHLKPEGLFERFTEYRRSLGMEVIATGDPDVVRKLVAAVRAGRVVPLLGDRDIGRHGVTVDLFGEPASFPAGPAVLAMLTGAALHPLTAWYEPWGTCARVHDRIAVPTEGTRAEKVQAMMQDLARAFEPDLREHSVDWHMMQPVWLADLDPARLANRDEG